MKGCYINHKPCITQGLSSEELVLSKITDVDAFNDDLQKPLALRAEETRNPPRGWDP